MTCVKIQLSLKYNYLVKLFQTPAHSLGNKSEVGKAVKFFVPQIQYNNKR